MNVKRLQSAGHLLLAAKETSLPLSISGGMTERELDYGGRKQPIELTNREKNNNR